MGSRSKSVDAYLQKLQQPQRSTLLDLRELLHQVLPAGDETIKYGMPCLTVQGKGVVGFMGFKNHCSYFPMSGGVLNQITKRPEWTDVTKGTLHFPFGKQLPKTLVRQLVRLRLDQISDIKNGTRFDFFDDGTLKAQGQMKNSQLHGKWQWFRRDGSLMRSGQFKNGKQIGVWQTWTKSGVLVKTTNF